MMTNAAILNEDPACNEPVARELNRPRSAYRPLRDTASEEELIQQHLPLVKTVVGRIAMTLPTHVDAEDLHSCGLIGLLNAIRQFNPRAGSSFESYARVRIRGAIIDELRRLDWVPRSIHDKARRVQKTMRHLEDSKSRLPTDFEMAAALNISVDQYHQLLEEVRPAVFVCLDRADPEDEVQGHDLIPDPTQEDPVEQTVRRELTRFIAERLRQLPDMQRKVLALYYDEDLRLREIAEVFGVTESRICQVHAQAILAIKSSLQKEEGRSEGSVLGASAR